MNVNDIIALCGAILVAGIAAPQFLLVVRTKRTDGLSLTTWILALGTGMSWLNHGIKLMEVHMIWANAWSLTVVITILYFLKRNGHYRSLVTLLPGISIGIGLILLDYLLGSMAFGLGVIIPQVWGMLRQGIELMRAREIVGVSITSWVFQVLTQVVWMIWAIRATEIGTLISTCACVFAATFVLVWRILRAMGYGPIASKKQAPPDDLMDSQDEEELSASLH